MKKTLHYIIVAGLLVFVSSCEKGLSEMNVNRTSPTAIDPVFILNTAVINTSFPISTVVYEIGIVQQIITPNGGVLAGANFNQDNRSVFGTIWQAYYLNVIKNTHDVIERTKDDASRGNLYHMARILQAYAFMVITDTYGDVPYTEGGAGYSDQIFYPKYDAQEVIYDGIISELTEAAAALNASSKIETSDLLYAGDVARWQKFGYSLLLRVGMRLSEVNPTKAQSVVQAAFNAGVILNNADNAYMRHDANYQNLIGNWLNGTEAANLYLTKPFIDHLKNTNDPRLSAIAIRYVGATSGPEQTPAIGNTSASTQIGMPMGYDNGTIGAAVAADGLASFYEYSQVDRLRLAKTTSPMFFVTASQTNLLLAEARERGWITTGTVEEYYNAGVNAHMQQMAAYDAGSAIAAGDIVTYFTNNPLNPGTALEQINTQYWISSFLNGPEAFANFRRSGYPALVPNPYSGKSISGDFINRNGYPNSELSVNTENVNDAIARQGPDDLDTKVWWDK